MKFEATIQLAGKTATGIGVPDEIVAALEAGNRPPVRVTVAGYTYRTTVARRHGEFKVPVSADVRERAGVAAGDKVRVEIELDTAPREVVVPAELADALAEHPTAKAAFEKLSYANRQRYVLAIEGAKTAETRQRRIAKALDELAAQ